MALEQTAKVNEKTVCLAALETTLKATESQVVRQTKALTSRVHGTKSTLKTQTQISAQTEAEDRSSLAGTVGNFLVAQTELASRRE